MKLVTFRTDGQADRLGALISSDDHVLDLQAAHLIRHQNEHPALASMLALMEAGKQGLDIVRDVIDQPPEDTVFRLDAVMLQTPLPRPTQIRDFLCFEEHLERSYAQLRQKRAQMEPDPEAALKEFEEKGLFRIPEVWYERPLYYKPSRMAVIGTEQDIEWPPYAELMDFELEFGCFTMGEAKNLTKQNAAEYIFGYSIFNDISARDEQVKEMPGFLGPGKGKDFDTCNVIGPCIVTADSIDPYNLTMIARVNGEEWARGNSSTMYWTFEDLLVHTSRAETIYPGEFFASGTVGGGCGLEWDKYLNDGDVIELEVEGIGILKNKIVKKQDEAEGGTPWRKKSAES